MKDFQHEQLFTELTPEQASVIEGGKTLRLYSIQCLNAGADLVGNDEAYLNFNGKTIWSRSMGTGDPAVPINKSYGFEGAPILSLFDDDGRYDDFIGEVGLNGGTGVITNTKAFTKSGSHYALTYQVLQ